MHYTKNLKEICEMKTHTAPTITLEALVNQAIQQGATVVTECGAGIAMGLESVRCVAGLKLWEENDKNKQKPTNLD